MRGGVAGGEGGEARMVTGLEWRSKSSLKKTISEKLSKSKEKGDNERGRGGGEVGSDGNKEEGGGKTQGGPLDNEMALC